MNSKATRIKNEVPSGIQRKWLDWKLGYALMGDRRVRVRYKVAAFAISIAAVAILAFLELPVEEIVAMIPVLGIIGDLSLDGVEAVLVPILLACLMLPYLAPRRVVDQILRERSPAGRPKEGPIIDV